MSVFYGLNNLTKLKIDNNNLNQISNFTFSHLESLTNLSLSNNYIDSLDINTFNNLNNLTYLSLSNNSIKYLKNILIQLKSLRELKLDNNTPGRLTHFLKGLQICLSSLPILKWANHGSMFIFVLFTVQ